MKLLLPSLTVLLALSAIATADPVGTAFTYQGRLDQNNAPAAGSFDMKFERYDAAANGNPVGAAIELPGRNIAGGLFSVDLDFGGPAVFDGTACWMEISAKAAGAEEYVKVPGRVAIRATPYAIHALQAASVKDGGVTENSLADGAVTSGKLAPAAVGLAQMNVPGVPANGQLLAYDGVDLAWVNPPAGGGAGSGPWLTSSAKVYYNAGPVGIGTSNPQAPLQVQSNWDGEYGNIRLTGSRPTLQWVRSRTFPEPNSTDHWLLHTSGTVQGNIAFYHRNINSSVFPVIDSGYRPLMSFTPSLTVGIGTETPAGRLHVFDASEAVQVIECGGGTNSGARLKFKNGNGQWETGTSRGFNGEQFYIYRSGTAVVQFGVQPNGDTFTAGDITATRLVLRADPNAPANAAVICSNASVTNFVPYNTALGRAMDVVANNVTMHDASVRKLTIRGGADLAEPFAMSHDGVEPGTVVVIDEKNPGKLRRSAHSYDKKVAGIVSGANGIEPGISMIQEDKLEAGENVALSGRVYVRANDGGGTIAPGDLLTTSSTAGEAMKAANHDRAQGAILGKAMTSLRDGSGMVLVLVTLQ